MKHNSEKLDNIKSFKIGIEALNTLFSFARINTIYSPKDENFFNNLEKIQKEIFQIIGTIIPGNNLNKLEIALLTPYIGTFLDIFEGAYLQSSLRNFKREEIDKELFKNIKKFSGINYDIDGQGIGNVELISSDKGGNFKAVDNYFKIELGKEELNLSELSNFTEFFSFDKCHYIAFEYNDMNVSQIINLINSKFLINNIKVESLDEIFDTILKEIAYGYYMKKNFLLYF